MKRNIVPLLGIAFVVAIAATGIFYGLFVGKLNDATAHAPKTSIVVAARAIPSGTVLKAADLKLMPWGGAQLIKGSFPSMEEAVGKTVFTPVDESEPVTQARLAGKGSGGLNIEQGMRAISVTISESGGILSILRQGHRVDLQAVNSHQGGDSKIRTILQDIEVLAVNPPEQIPGKPPGGPTVTLLVRPRDADQLALADSAIKLRVLLRNPIDREKDARPSVMMANLFQESKAYHPSAMRQAIAAPVPPPAPAAFHKLNLLVKIAAATPKAMEEMSGRFSFPRHSELLQVSALESGEMADGVLRRLEAQQSLEVYSITQLTTGNNREVSMRTGSNWHTSAGGEYGLRIQFLPTWNQSGGLRIRVEPEITSPGTKAASTRKFESEVELADGQSFVVTGLCNPADLPSLAERLFAGRAKEPLNRELFVVVTPRLLRPVLSAAHRETSE